MLLLSGIDSIVLLDRSSGTRIVWLPAIPVLEVLSVPIDVVVADTVLGDVRECVPSEKGLLLLSTISLIELIVVIMASKLILLGDLCTVPFLDVVQSHVEIWLICHLPEESRSSEILVG